MSAGQTTTPSVTQLASDLWSRIDTTTDLVELAEKLCAGGQDEGRVLSLLRVTVEQLHTLQGVAQQLHQTAEGTV